MIASAPSHPELLAEFVHWRAQNQAGGWACRWRRRGGWLASVRQRLGAQINTDAPLFFGGRMRVVTNETVSTGIMSFGYGEPAITALMLHELQEGETFVDVGTHFGYEAMLAARLTGPHGRVFAFEPNPGAYAFAAHNLRDSSHVHLSSSAVGAKRGRVFMTPPPICESAFNQLGAGAQNESTLNVEVITLDEVLGEAGGPVHFIKCDAEGFELDILQGSSRVLSENQPLIVVESGMPMAGGQSHPRAHEFARFLAQWDYVGASFEFAGELMIAPLDQMRVHHASVLFVPPQHRLRALLQ